MNRCLIALLSALVLLSACSNNKRTEPYQPSMAQAEKAAEAAADSLNATTDEEEMPTAADELFDDFFFNYASNLTQQRERTVFPLPVSDGGNTRTIQQKQWKLEPFFMKQDYYTLIFDSERQMELVRDTAVSTVTVERIYLDKGRVEQFMFSRSSGRWMLHEVKWVPLPQNANAQFLSFYQQFATDSLFQRKSLAQQIQFSGPDPDDDFSTIDGVITPDFWDAFRPELPHDMIYNIVYEQQNPAAKEKLFLLRGIANGLEVEITFHQQKGQWKLTKLST
jgi:Tfp pilus assembly protein PilP